MKRLAAFLALYFGVPLVLLGLPGALRRWFGVEAGMWVIPTLLLTTAAVLAAERAAGPLGRELAAFRVPAGTWRRTLLRFAVGAALLTGLLAAVRPESLLSFPRHNPRLWLLVLFAYPVLSVVPQGVLYRWFYERRFARLFPSPRASLLAGAVAFSFAHIVFRNVWALAFTFAGGLFFLSTYRRTRSALFADLEHALYGDFLFTIGWGDFFFEGTRRFVEAAM